MMNKVYCPWCGSEMKLRYESYVRDDGGLYYYVCTNKECFSKSPINEDKELAYAAAIRRQLQKPLEYRELEDEKFVWVEWNEENVYGEVGIEPAHVYFVDDDEFQIDRIGSPTGCGLHHCSYNRIMRCWATKPSEEERGTAKWE